MKGCALAAEELDDGESDGIWTARRAGGEDSVRAIVDGRRAEKFESFRAVEDPYNEEVRETLDVGEAGFELWKDFENPFGFVFSAGAFGDLLRALVGTLHLPDRLRGKHDGVRPLVDYMRAPRACCS